MTTDPSLPPGFLAENIRDIYIPRYPNDPLRPNNCDLYRVDVSWLLVINDEHHMHQLRYIVAWYTTLGNFLWKSEIALKVVTSVYKQRLSQTTGETRVTILKDEYLPTSYDWVFWKGQVEWLSNMYNSLGKLISPLQSYNAMCRAELGHPT